MYMKKYDEEAGFNNFVEPKDKEEFKPKRVKPLLNPNLPDPNGPKVCCLMSPTPSDEELTFICQQGVTHVFTWVEEPQTTREYLTALRKKCESFGLILYNVGNRGRAKKWEWVCADVKRDECIAKFIDLMQILKDSGIFLTTFTWESDQVWSSHKNLIRGNTLARACDMEIINKIEITHGREYTEEEIWENMKYWLDRVIPEAEKLGVKIALHPNDPPVPKIGGIPCLIRNKEAYEKVYSYVKNSNVLGMEFCCGCWLEGGEKFGNLYESLGDYVKRNKVFIVHLRNVTSCLPNFTETFIDDGYGDVFEIIRTLVKNNYEGTVILDHTPYFVGEGGPHSATAFCNAYLKASIVAAQHLKDKL